MVPARSASVVDDSGKGRRKMSERKWLRASSLQEVTEGYGHYVLYGSDRLTEDLEFDMRGMGCTSNMRRSLEELSRSTRKMEHPVYGYLPDSTAKEAENWMEHRS